VNYNSLLPYASAVVGGVLAVVALSRPRRTPSRWAFAAGMAVLAAESVLIGLDADAPGLESTLHWQQWRMILLSLLPGTWMLFSLCYARGDARRTLARWRLLLLATVLLPLGFTLVLHEDLLLRVVIEGELFLQVGWPGIALHVFLLFGSIFVLMNLERTYRASVGTMRWRIKFMLMGVGLLFIVRIYTSSQILLFRGLDPIVEIVNSAALLVAALLFLRSFFRDNEFNLDVYPSQSVLQNSVTALLAGAYLLLVGLFAKVVVMFGGDSTFTLKALLALVSIVLLALLLQSDRVRLRLRRFVSEHFQRPYYDYRIGWKKFTEGTASCVEQTDLSRALIRLIAEIFQVLSVSIWLVDEQRQNMTLAASTVTPRSQAPDRSDRKAETATLIAHFQAHPEPVDFESVGEPWAATLRTWHPAEFEKGGHRVCIPIQGRGEVLGLISLGDRIAGVAFSLQDFEMLKCVSDHAASCLLNIQLSKKLLQAKELEAFQTMAAFFVHDLKNAASTLNLMLRNLPDHFDDPAFREDALRGIGKTVSHINNLISRLSLLRHELKIQPAPSDLNDVVEKAVAGLESGSEITLTKALIPLPSVPLDQDQMAKVVINLVLNAREAISGRGEIHLETTRTEGWVVMTVRDTGCGMTSDYINRALFRPFQTTKKSGLGIGMFQSKMIVEAHSGRITVASEPGRGTTFQVFLPVSSQ
jgi:putative PEP-CTERM system histidine kinase